MWMYERRAAGHSNTQIEDQDSELVQQSASSRVVKRETDGALGPLVHIKLSQYHLV